MKRAQLSLQRFHPANWSLVCWVACACWSLYFIAQNTPIDHDSLILTSENTDTDFTAWGWYWPNPVKSYGWPMTYLDIEYPRDYQHLSRKWALRPVGSICNIAFASSVYAFLIFWLQFFAKQKSSRVTSKQPIDPFETEHTI